MVMTKSLKKNLNQDNQAEPIKTLPFVPEEDQDFGKVRELRQRYEYIINNISEIIFQTDKDAHFTFLNSVWIKVTGFENSIGKIIFDFIDDNDREGFRREFNDQIVHQSGKLTYEARVKTKHRDSIWTEIQLQPVYSSENILCGTTGTITDIDINRKNFSELRYRLMFERIIMDISTELMNFEPVELEEKINHSLRLLCEISGYDSLSLGLFSADYDRIENIFSWDLNAGKAGKPECRPLPESSQILNRLMKLETIFLSDSLENPEHYKDDLIISGKKPNLLMIPLVFNKVLTAYFRFESSQINEPYDNERICLLRTAGEILVNAVKRMFMQKALIESENNYRLVVNNIKEVIFKLNIEGEIDFLNKAWTDITGFGLRESLSVNFLIFIYPEDRQKNLEQFKTIIGKEKEYVRYQTRMITLSGSYKWTEIYMNSVVNGSGITGISGTITDITQRKQSETLQNALYEIAILTSVIDDLDKFYRSLHSILIVLMDARNFCFINFNEITKEISFPYFENIKTAKPPSEQAGNGLVEKIFSSNNPVLINKENRYQMMSGITLYDWEEDFVDFVGIPLRNNEELLGGIAIYNYDENIRYGRKDMEILTTIAHHIINALERKKFIEELRNPKKAPN